MANVTNGHRLSTTTVGAPQETIDAASAAQLSRIADSLDVIIRMIREDQKESKKRWAEKDE